MGEACFFLQLHWDAAPGLPLSMSSTQSTTECVASLALGYLTADLEALLRACRSGTIGATLPTLHCAPSRAVHAADYGALPSSRPAPCGGIGRH